MSSKSKSEYRERNRVILREKSRNYNALPQTKKRNLESQRIRRLANPEKYKNEQRRSYLKYKMIVINHYGGKCACCGETNVEFLSIDHINNNGAEHRNALKISSGIQFYLWLIKNIFPSGFQVLCMNCNLAKRSGVCPHKKHQNDWESEL